MKENTRMSRHELITFLSNSNANDVFKHASHHISEKNTL